MDKFTNESILSSESGFTLIEAMCALMIFSVGILGVNSLQVSTIGGNSQAFNITSMINASQTEVEELMALPYNDALLAIGTNAVDADDLPDGADSVTLTVSAGHNLKYVTMAVTKSFNGVQKTMTTNFVKYKK